MRLISAVDRKPTPWFWGINGAAGVLAATLAVALQHCARDQHDAHDRGVLLPAAHPGGLDHRPSHRRAEGHRAEVGCRGLMPPAGDGGPSSRFATSSR